MNGILTALCGLMGGLAMFLYGMQTMSAALERAAGDGLRRALAAATKTPLLGAAAGAGATALLQSSSAVTVTVIGFVSARLMDLPRAVAVLFGANVGTTVTGQLLAFHLGPWVQPLLLAGLLPYLAARKQRTRDAGLALFSFGLLFIGMQTMGAAMEPLASSPRALALLAQTAKKPLLGLLLGAAMTAAIQSSSASVAILQSLLSRTGADAFAGLAGAMPILLGCNIGTTVTALLAAVGQSKDALRTALAHFLFNVSGSALCLIFLPGFTKLVLLLSPAGATLARQVANAHTLFNLLCTAAWLPMLRLMVRLVTAAVPDKDGLRRETYG